LTTNDLENSRKEHLKKPEQRTTALKKDGKFNNLEEKKWKT
jgi:hypothetical protein